MIRHENSRDVLMSIQPVIGRRVISGRKKYECRRSIFRKLVNRIYLYLSSPVRKIAGYFVYQGYMEGTVQKIWEATKDKSAATETAYLEYFKNTDKAFAIPIDRQTPGFLPPQSFRYVKSGFYGEK
jgi:predicted transcriptional regulator